MIQQDRFPPSARVCLALLALLASWLQAAIQPAEAASYSLGLPVNISGGDSWGHRAVAVGDVDHDGRDDIVVGQEDGVVWFHLQTAAGQLAPPQRHRLLAQSVYALEIVDLDRDGTAELLAGHEGGLAIYKHAQGWRYAPGGAGCRLLAVGDIDLDGWSDVACAGGAGLVTLYFNDRQGGFAAPAYMWTPSNMLGVGALGQMLLEDVTGDGRPDLLMATSRDTGFFVHAHDGSRGFLPAYGIAQAGSVLNVGGLAILDVDGDGVVEVLTTSSCNTPCSTLHLFRRDGLGYYRHYEDVPTLDIPQWPIVHDIDRNGAEDLLVLHRGWSTLGRYMSSSSGRLSRSESTSRVTTSAVGPRAFALGDVNSDGCTDVAVANSMGLSLLHGICSGERGADFDGDHESDVFWRNTATGENLMWPSAAANRALPVQAVTQTAWRIVGQGDFDGDLRSDLLWRHATTGANAIWLSADFATPRAVTGVSDVRWQVVGVGDFDGDRRSDILWRHAITGANAIWKSGRHDSQQAIMGVSDVRWRVAGVGDFDGDGRSDILWRHSATGENAIWASGRYDTPIRLADVTDLRWQVAGLGDFNGDGMADIFWRHGVDGQNTIWLGGQGWARWPVMGVSNLAWKVAAIGDYDASGSSDVLWRNTATGANAIWRSADYASQIPVATRAGPWVVAPGP